MLGVVDRAIPTPESQLRTRRWAAGQGWMGACVGCERARALWCGGLRGHCSANERRRGPWMSDRCRCAGLATASSSEDVPRGGIVEIGIVGRSAGIRTGPPVRAMGLLLMSPSSKTSKSTCCSGSMRLSWPASVVTNLGSRGNGAVL